MGLRRRFASMVAVEQNLLRRIRRLLPVSVDSDTPSAVVRRHSTHRRVLYEVRRTQYVTAIRVMMRSDCIKLGCRARVWGRRVALVTGSIARSANLPVFSLLRGQF